MRSLTTAVLLFLSSMAQATLVGGINLDDQVYLDNTLMQLDIAGGNGGVEVGSNIQGIGRITAISDGDGLSWRDGDNSLSIWYYFDDLNVASVEDQAGRISFELDEDTTSVFRFFTMSDPSYNPSGDFVSDRNTLISDGAQWLSMSSSGSGSGYLSEIQSNTIGGFSILLDVDPRENSGDWSANDYFDIRLNNTDSLLVASFASDSTGEFDYSGSSNLRPSSISETPEPSTLVLMSLVALLAGPIRSTRRKAL